MKAQTGVRRLLVDRRGLTLLELVIVMGVLAALAAILIPMLPNLLTQAHTSAAATNEAEVTKAVQMYISQTNLLPNNLDSLVDASGKLFPSLPAVMTTGSQLALDLIPSTPTSGDISALTSAGLTSVLPLADAATTTNSVWSPTFYPYGDGTGGLAVAPTSTAVSTAPTLVQLSPAAASRLGLQQTTQANTYYVLGLGGYSTMQGTAMDETPIHWMVNMTMPSGATMSMSPTSVYSRFGLLYQTATGTVSGTTTTLTPLSRAKFVGTVLLAGVGVTNANTPISNFLSTQ